MATLITGGTGMIGSYVARMLIERGERPVLFDLSSDDEQIGDIENQATILRGDVLDTLGLIRAIKSESIDSIVHAAAVLALGAKEPLLAVKVNVEGGTSVLEAARLASVNKVVFVSTRQVYDFGKEMSRPIDEDFPTLPGGIYASTKLACEHLGLNYAQIYGIRFVALRFARVFGPGYWSARSTPNLGTRAVKDMIEGGISGRPVTITRPASERDEWLYVKDAAQAIVKARDRDNLRHSVFNVGSGALYEFEDIVTTIRKYIPTLKLTLLDHDRNAADRRIYQTSMAVPTDIGRSVDELGYKPAYSLDAAIRDYVSIIEEKFRSRAS